MEVKSQVAMRLDLFRQEPFLHIVSNQSYNNFNVEELIPAYAAAASLVLLLVHFVGYKVLPGLKKPADVSEDQTVAQASLTEKVKKHVKKLGGGWIFAFMSLRLVGAFALLVLALVSFALDSAKDIESTTRLAFGLSVTSAYMVLLTSLSLFADLRWSSISTRHLNSLWLITLIIYGYRNLYPLATFTLSPVDKEEGGLLWAKIGLLVFFAIVVPLAIPRQYIPLNPKDPAPIPAPEQTTSLFSLVFYFFIDPIVFEAYRVTHLPYEHLPPLADYDYARNLRSRAFKHLDRFSGLKRRRHLFFSLMRIFWREYSIMSLMTMLQAVADLSIPIGVEKLLRYIEIKGDGATIRPWVWIAWLLVGPTISSVAFEWYIFVSTRSIVHTESIITQVVFEHALRIRVKAETSTSAGKIDTAQSTNGSMASETASLATSQGELDTSPSISDDDETLHSTATAAQSDLTVQGGNGSGTKSHTASLKGVPALKATQAVGESSVAGASSRGSTTTGKATSTSEPKSESSKNLAGKLNNLVSTDLQNIVDAKDFIRFFALVPIQTALCIWFLYRVLGWSAFVGLGVIILCFPIPGLLTRLIQQAQRARMKRTDARVQVVTEIMNVLRMVKMFGWEKKMYDRISAKRDEELTWIKWLRLLGMMTGLANFIIPVLTMLATYSTYLLRMSIFLLTQSLNGKVSLDRITEFLYETELLDSWTKPEEGALTVSSPPPAPDAIGFRNATFSWSADTDEGSYTPSRRKFLLKIDEELLFRKGVINVIIGPTGSGKTSVLMALLSEMHFIPSSPDSWYGLPRASGVAYAAQESWVQNATIRDNIVFGAEFDEARYKAVLYQCCLERDLTLFKAGDQTEVGEKGLTLSGGQKARVTLARAVYSQAEIILLDDVLAALDVHTSKWIVDKCLKGDLIRGRTVLLVTHNVVLVQPLAGFVVSIKDGRIASQGSVSEALSSDETLAAEAQKEEDALERAEEEVDQQLAPEDASSKDGKLILAEEVELGHVSWSALKLFLTTMGGNHVFLFFFSFVGLYLACELAENGQTYFLGYWANRYELVDNPSDVNVVFYIGIYILIMVFLVASFALGYIVYLFGVLRASKIIHQRLVTSVIGTTLRWLDTTPTSRVITRCTQDIRDIDDPLAQMFGSLVQMSLSMIIKFLAVIAFTPAFFVPAALVGVLGFWCGNVYIKAQLPVKREMSNAKAPVLGHFGAAMTGLTSIRAYGAEEAFRKEVRSRIDYYARPSRTFYNLNRWIDVRVDAISNLFACLLAAYLIYVSHMSSSDTGFSLTMAVGFSGMILWWIRIVNQFEVRGNSLERIGAYINIEQEPKSTVEGKPPAHWPSSGELRVEGLSARYSPNGPKVLQNLSFDVKSGERIGVVGRTGSGKSSLMLSLLRLIFSEGTVYYDGIPTSSVNLEDLRFAITIIPQMPELLSGSVRENLDPFDQYDDASLNSALRSAGLFSLQGSGDMEGETDNQEDKITLDSAIASGGNNLSVGQRQIIALARAMVRESKLLILDEATSAIDYKTDSIIQSSLRNELKNDVTLITVAHRLQTIMDADKIMVLDAGNIVEYDSPTELLKNKDGKLRSLVDESSDKEHLYAMVVAKEHRT